ncbi:MAG: ABC transporter substrate-binding protein [Terricaulis sp.]
MPKNLFTRSRLMVFGACIAAIGALLLPSAFGVDTIDTMRPSDSAGATLNVQASPTEVMHFWNSGSERAALNLIRDSYVAQGGEWIDNPQADHGTLRRALIDRLSTNTPPSRCCGNPMSSCAIWPSSACLAISTWSPRAIIGTRCSRRPCAHASQIDGHYFMAPTNIHANNWIFYNAPLLRRLGIAEPQTWDEMLAAMERIRAAGVRPVAIGPGDWEAQILFGTIFAGTLGRDDYRDLISNRNPAVIDKPGVIEAFRIFGEIRDILRRDEPYADWASAAQAVAHGDAGFEFMGDWAKGRNGARRRPARPRDRLHAGDRARKMR